MALGNGVTGGSATNILTNTGAITITTNTFADPVDGGFGFAGIGSCSASTL